MPFIESRPDALAFVYARSLLELANEQGGAERIESILGQLEDILEVARLDRRFGEFLASQTLTRAARSDALRRIFEGRCDDLVFRFILLLNEKRRLGHYPAILAAYDALVQQRFGRVEVDVYTAHPIDVSELSSIKARLSDIMGKDVVVHPYTDESMIGGVKLRIGDTLVDASLASMLRRVRDRLHTEGAAELRARAQGILDQSHD
jgi:F-type H+-transporting ATPase subunit delta